MRTIPFDVLLDWMLSEYASQRTIFGLPEAVFHVPKPDDPFSTTLFGERLETPIGPAAGPHTQLAQNIISAWLTGGRFIELKTVQIMDALDIPRPCIDMADEGYNVEWSQELRLHQSLAEYVKAWALVHILQRVLGFEASAPLGTIFNMSVGYNLEGITSPPMVDFMSHLENASEDLSPVRAVLRSQYPQFSDLEIPDRITHSVTLSTMHGCPPDEIERIARYLIEDRGLHTTVKLNPTLLGKDAVLRTLHETLGFAEIDIPDRVFAHDLDYHRALDLIRSLQATARTHSVDFRVKLSNTLAMSNHRGVLPGDEMYMSGRALFPVTVQLFQRLRSDVGSSLPVSFSAGADAVNIPQLLAAGAHPITVASDLLKPGGYGRLSNDLAALRAAMSSRGVSSLREWAADPAGALDALVDHALSSPRYTKTYHVGDLPKVALDLSRFDCIQAPCVAHCAACQDVPDYAHWIQRREYDAALSAILHRNPLPACTGHVCTHECQSRCTRHNYDEPVAIRRLKRFAVEHSQTSLAPAPYAGHRVAVIGSGPSGLSAAFYLALSGIRVTVLEAKDRPGGMPAIAPQFRLPEEAITSDIERIRGLGVEIRCNSQLENAPETLLQSGYSAVYVACGFARDASLSLDGGRTSGIVGALEFLDRVAHGNAPELGDHVVVIGGGNTAMDAARTAQRLTGAPTLVVYRRTRAEMPADVEEVNDLLLEGNRLEELAVPQRLHIEHGRITGLECLRAKLEDPGPDGRRRAVAVEGTSFMIPASFVIEAIGQRSDVAFLDESALLTRVSDGGIDVAHAGRTSVPGVYAGGDIARGPAIIIAACADGRSAAADICHDLGVPFRAPELPELELDDLDRGALRARRTRLSTPHAPGCLDVSDRSGFDTVEQSLTEEQAAAEAARCLQCQLLCDKCVDVCPNRANVSIRVSPITCVLPRFERVDGLLQPVGTEAIQIRQRQQVLHIDDLCNECGNCTTFCVHQGRPYRDKPRLFLTRDAFDAETDNAFWIEPGGMSCKVDGETARWREAERGTSIYEVAGARFVLDAGFVLAESDVRRSESEAISLRPAVEMAVLARAVRSSASHLPLSNTTEGSSI